MHIFADFCLSIHLRQVTPAVRRFIRATTFGPQSLKIDLFLLSFTSGGRRYLFHIQTQRCALSAPVYLQHCPSSDDRT